MDIQVTNCMLASRTADSWLNLENECISCQFDLEVQDKRNWIPSGKWSIHRHQRDRSDEMLIMTPSGVYTKRNVSKDAQSWSVGIPSFLTTSMGTRGTRNPAAGKMAADALPGEMAVPMPAPATNSAGTKQRAGCTSGDPMCRNMATA